MEIEFTYLHVHAARYNI